MLMLVMAILSILSLSDTDPKAQFLTLLMAGFLIPE
jgi:hypothetical protein